MISTNTERKIGMALDYLGYRIRCQIEKGEENNWERQLMSSKKCLIIWIVVFLNFLVSTSVVFAIGDDRYSRPSLKGLKKLSVVVQIEKRASEDLKKAGLTEDRIRAGVELKLQEAKINVVSIEDLSSDTPILHVEVDGSKKTDKTFSFLIEVELWQKSFLKRDPKVEVIAGTWSTGVFGLGSASSIANDMMGLINGMVNIFVKAYLSVNS
jgi:exopolysaccharide biosynthesis protein